MVEMIDILEGRLGKCSVERVRYVFGHCEIWSHFTRLRLVTILSLLMKYLVIFHADPCNKSYIIGERAKRARHSQVCSIENRGYIYILYIMYSTCNFCPYNP